MAIFSRKEAGAQLLRDTRGDPPDNGVLLSAHELPVDALCGGLSSSWLVNAPLPGSSLKLRAS